MRVITGTARGCRLETLPGEDTRPTAARVKEGLFSAIQFDLEGRQVLDLFAGSGQLGIEALSRGAAGCVFVDKNPDAVTVIRRNLAEVCRLDSSLSKNANILNLDSMAYLARSKDHYDAVFLDPPYAAGLLEPALRAVVPLMNPGGFIVCESDAGLKMPEQVGEFTLARVYRYGRILVWLYRFAAAENLPDGQKI